MLLEKYANSSVSQYTTSEITTLAKRGKTGNKQLPPNDKQHWKNVMLKILTYRSPIITLHKTITNTTSNKQGDDKKSM